MSLKYLLRGSIYLLRGTNGLLHNLNNLWREAHIQRIEPLFNLKYYTIYNSIYNNTYILFKHEMRNVYKFL
jgi:hypothetical protein